MNKLFLDKCVTNILHAVMNRGDSSLKDKGALSFHLIFSKMILNKDGEEDTKCGPLLLC